jgi:hypothetical protein
LRDAGKKYFDTHVPFLFAHLSLKQTKNNNSFTALRRKTNFMKDFLLLIKTEGSVWTDLSPEHLQKHMANGGAYIGNLMKEGKLKSAQPVDKGSRIVTSENDVIKDGPFNESKEVIAGYYHIVAKDIDEAVAIAKANPIFKDIPTKIEVHPMMPVGGN